MNIDDRLYSPSKSDNINIYRKNSGRPSIIIEKLKQIYKNIYKSKWSNLKFFIQDIISLKSSIRLLKRKTIEQFSSKCIEIYRKKLQIQLITQKNREMFSSLQFNYNNNNMYTSTNLNNDEIISQLKIQGIEDIPGIEPLTIKDFFFKFREDNNLMMALIECLDNDQFEIIVPFLCHFFYENFYIENNEQEEILYIIYLVLEKEIDTLYTPSVSTFLDKSFVSMFLSEMGNRYEIKHYIDIILNYLIRNIEEINISFYSLDIERNKEKEKLPKYESNKKLDMKIDKYSSLGKIKEFKKDDTRITYNNINLQSNTFNTVSIGGILNKKNFFEKDNKSIVKNESKHKMKTILKKELYDILFTSNIDEKFLRNKFEKETDDIMKHFYVRLLRQINSASNPDLYNTNKYFENLIEKNQNISEDILEDFNKGYFLVTKFISELLDNLENIKIMPYSIKVICKFISTLLKKKFKNISQIQCNILVNRFLFDKLLLPVIQNPDINDTGKNMIITLNTRKNLNNIYKVLKKLIRGELFNIEHYTYMTVFNSFIINNFGRLSKIIENILKVNAPSKLMKLSEQFCNDKELNEIKRDEQSVNYDYFEENPHDFMHHKSICFSMKELNLFFDIINNNKERFIQSESLKNIYENLSSFISSLTFKPYEYCVIISDNYNKEVNELLFIKEPKITLGKAKTKNDILNNIKHCIRYLITNLDVFPNWVMATENLDTIDTFKYINSYLNLYYNKKNKIDAKKVPLNWYSLYIINNLKNLEEKYISNDFQLLYDSIESEITYEIKKARYLNNFLTINMTTKNFLIDNKIKKYDHELDNVKSTELNIKTAQFIESAKINVCLTNYLELNNMIKYINSPLDSKSQNNPYMLIISKEKDCIHQQKMEKKTYKKLKDSLKMNNIHCSNINEFTHHLSEYYVEIGEDILDSYKTQNGNYNVSDDSSYTKKKKYSKEIIQISKKTMVKEVLEEYKKYVIETMNESNLFNLTNYEENNSYNGNDNDNLVIKFENQENDFQTKEDKKRELLKKYEEEKNKSLNIISNYILKRLSIKIYEENEKDDDREFRNTCIKLNWISHRNLDIPDEVFNKNLFYKVIEHVKRMDYLRTPNGMLYEFGLGVQLINSMFIFMLNQRQAEAGDLLPLIIYSIIAAKPKKIIFNIKFIKFFIDQNQLLGNIGYNLIQCESSIHYISSLNEKQLKMDKQEFEDKCKLSITEYNIIKERKALKNKIK